MLNENFSEEVCNRIHTVLGNIRLSEGRDKAWWMPCASGKFSIGSAWELCRQRKDPLVNVLNLWEKGLAYKVSFSVVEDVVW